MVPERLKTIFKKKKKDIVKFAAKEAIGLIPYVGSILKDAIDEFYPDEKKEVMNELEKLTEKEFQEISDMVGISVEHLKDIQKITIQKFEELREDHKHLLKGQKEIISILKPEIDIPTIKSVLKKGAKGDFFKKAPEWIDFEEGFIVERREVAELIKKMEKDNIQLVLGEPASGKSIILKNIAFKLTNENKKVYFVELKTHSRDEVKKYFENIPKINNEEAVFIVDDAHLYITDCERLINDFKSRGKGRLIIGSRETSEIRGEDPKKASPFESLEKTNIHAENVTEEIIKRFLKKKNNNLSNERINTVSKNLKQYKKDLWFLSWALKTYDQKKDSVEEKEIYKNIIYLIRKVDAGKDKPEINAEDIFLPLSIFYRYEIPIERNFMENKKQMNIEENIIDQLIEMSEIVEIEEEGSNKMLSLNHSSIAELYFGAYQRYPDLGKKIRDKILEEKYDKYKKDLECSLFYRYMTSTSPGNVVDVVYYLGRNWDHRERCLTLLKQLAKDKKIQKSIKEGIDKEEDIKKIGWFVGDIADASKEVGLKLVESVSTKIDKEEDIEKIGLCVGDIAFKSKEVGSKLVESINLDVLSSKIDKEEDIDKIRYCVGNIARRRKEVGLKLVESVSTKIDKEEDIKKIGWCVWHIARASKEVGLKLVESINFDILLSKIDKEDDIEKIGLCVGVIAYGSKEVVLKLVESINLDVLSSKIDKEDDLKKIGCCVRDIAFKSKEVGSKLVESINLDVLSSKIDKEDDIDKITWGVGYIEYVSKEVGLKLVESINLDVLSSKIDKEDDLLKIGSCFRSIAEASIEVAQEIVNRLLKPELIEELQKEGYLSKRYFFMV